MNIKTSQKTIVYREQTDVKDISCKCRKLFSVCFYGSVFHETNRKFFCLPLPDRYTHSIETTIVNDTAEGPSRLDVKHLTFDSRKRVNEKLIKLKEKIKKQMQGIWKA